MSIKGWMYLHVNGDLIYKNYPDAIVDIRDSDLCRMGWPIDPEDREGAWRCLVEAIALGAKKERIKELSQTWNCNDSDADIYAERVGIDLKLDGNAWCATRKDFTNLMESPVGFGDTKLEAMGELCKGLGYKACKLGWGSGFKDLVKVESPT